MRGPFSENAVGSRRGCEDDAVGAMFRVARNPETESSLPYVISVPLSSGELVLKTKDVWPRTSKVYCHKAEGWPELAEVRCDPACAGG